MQGHCEALLVLGKHGVQGTHGEIAGQTTVVQIQCHSYATGDRPTFHSDGGRGATQRRTAQHQGQGTGVAHRETRPLEDTSKQGAARRAQSVEYRLPAWHQGPTGGTNPGAKQQGPRQGHIHPVGSSAAKRGQSLAAAGLGHHAPVLSGQNAPAPGSHADSFLAAECHLPHRLTGEAIHNTDPLAGSQVAVDFAPGPGALALVTQHAAGSGADLQQPALLDHAVQHPGQPFRWPLLGKVGRQAAMQSQRIHAAPTATCHAERLLDQDTGVELRPVDQPGPFGLGVEQGTRPQGFEVARSTHHGDVVIATSPTPPDALKQRGHIGRRPDQDDDVDVSDIQTHLQGAGGHTQCDRGGAEALLGLQADTARQAAVVCQDRVSERRPAPHVPRKGLDLLAAVTECEDLPKSQAHQGEQFLAHAGRVAHRYDAGPDRAPLSHDDHRAHRGPGSGPPWPPARRQLRWLPPLGAFGSPTTAARAGGSPTAEAGRPARCHPRTCNSSRTKAPTWSSKAGVRARRLSRASGVSTVSGWTRPPSWWSPVQRPTSMPTRCRGSDSRRARSLTRARVGLTTSTRAAASGRAGRCRSHRGTRQASVLPEAVGAHNNRSAPAPSEVAAASWTSLGPPCRAMSAPYRRGCAAR